MKVFKIINSLSIWNPLWTGIEYLVRPIFSARYLSIERRFYDYLGVPLASSSTFPWFISYLFQRMKGFSLAFRRLGFSTQGEQPIRQGSAHRRDQPFLYSHTCHFDNPPGMFRMWSTWCFALISERAFANSLFLFQSLVNLSRIPGLI